ncbi:PHD and RING finger domain-containing protein 1 [Sesamum angolense]|uniref:PHD and RING finger domain-containing protein 1 n=1 Tax=Sesamum angolense TaxID=2727404 RepID=A0AAE1W000_9LAMI|nr:PHD and RING finger domain-containing protein 1 [Sesamum angolense]
MRPESSDASPNKRIKTITPAPHSPPSLISKGKSKIQEGESLPIKAEVENESADCCGICLSEAGDGGVSRGYIDSCNHYFCFLCIMEWAKVESKCPLCKRRFSAIRRPPKPPIFASERIVHVPVRDQELQDCVWNSPIGYALNEILMHVIVYNSTISYTSRRKYHYFGNATVGPPDPYSEAKCSVCHGVADESLLLLCDLCDSAAHTYCVGLGVTVPEGDWYCQDCTLLRDERLKNETNTDSGVQVSFDAPAKISSANDHVSVFDIVRETCGHAALQSPRSASSDLDYLPRPSSNNVETSVINSIDRPISTSLETVTQHPTKPNARTLRHCRNLHNRIRVLRQSWNGLRSGILHFSSSAGDGDISSKKSMSCVSERHSVSCAKLQSTAQCSSSVITNGIEAHEIDRAWKMLDKAKSIRQGHGTPSIVHQASKCPTRRPNTIERADWSGKQKWKWHMTEDATKLISEGLLTGLSPTNQELESSEGTQTPSYACTANLRTYEKPPAEKSFKEPACLSSSVMSESVVVNVDVKGVNHTSSSCSKVKNPKEKSKLEQRCVTGQLYNDAKSEIQSLVKLNLKLQTKVEKLEVDAFKEVAWLATHSILASCGLEHPKSGTCSIPGIICSHPNEVRQLQKFSLMPNSCRECFYVFVKDVVNMVLLQKKQMQKKA